MNAFRKVLHSLERDQERHFSREASNSLWRATDEDRDREPRRRSLKEVAQKVNNINAVFDLRSCVKNSHILEIGQFRFDKPRAKEHSDFLAKILNNSQLMSESAKLLHSVLEPLFVNGSSQEDVRRNVSAASSRNMHRLKVCTVHVCYEDHMMPLQDELSDLNVRYDSLKARFSECRDAYLKEVSMLRDNLRTRGNLMEDLPSFDICYFIDPADMLTPAEQRFLFSAVCEKLKMILEQNPNIEQSFNLGQLERLRGESENHEMQELRTRVQRTSNALQQAQEELASLRRRRGADEGPIAKESVTATRMISVLEDQVAELQTKLFQERSENSKVIEHVKSLELERDGLLHDAQTASVNSLLRQNELQNMSDELDSALAVAEKAELDKECIEALLSARDEEIRNLKRMLERNSQSKHIVTRTSSTQTYEPPAFFNDTDITSANVGTVFAGRLSSQAVPDAAAVTVGSEQHSIENSDLSIMADDQTYTNTIGAEVDLVEAMRARDCALSRCRELESEVEQLRRMLRLHMLSLASLKAEEMLDNSQDLAEEASELGCMDSELVDSNLRICSCGNVLVQDAIFCRKCGSRWQRQEGHVSIERETVVTLAARHHDIEMNATVAMAALQSVLETKDVHDDDGEWLLRAKSAENELAKLQHDQTNLAAKLLMARLREANSNLAMESLDGMHCTCHCVEKLAAVRKLNERLQALCTESAVKLKRAAAETYTLSCALNKVQQTLGHGVDAIAKIKYIGLVAGETGGSCSVEEARGSTGDSAMENGQNPIGTCLQTLQDAQRHSVFNRLYNKQEDSSVRARRQARRERLLRDAFQSVYKMVDVPNVSEDQVISMKTETFELEGQQDSAPSILPARQRPASLDVIAEGSNNLGGRLHGQCRKERLSMPNVIAAEGSNDLGSCLKVQAVSVSKEASPCLDAAVSRAHTPQSSLRQPLTPLRGDDRPTTAPKQKPRRSVPATRSPLPPIPVNDLSGLSIGPGSSAPRKRPGSTSAR